MLEEATLFELLSFGSWVKRGRAHSRQGMHGQKDFRSLMDDTRRFFFFFFPFLTLFYK